jgi:hypothetical protein
MTECTNLINAGFLDFVAATDSGIIRIKINLG